jgi:hypothetical protein
MLADMIKSKLNGNLQDPDSSKFILLHSPLLEFAELKANKQIHAGGFVRLAYVDDINGTPQFCRSYLPRLRSFEEMASRRLSARLQSR